MFYVIFILQIYCDIANVRNTVVDNINSLAFFVQNVKMPFVIEICRKF